jgi:hypothetical protein
MVVVVLVVVVVVVVLVITFMQGTSNYVPATNYASRVYSVAAIQYLQFVTCNVISNVECLYFYNGILGSSWQCQIWLFPVVP